MPGSTARSPRIAIGLSAAAMLTGPVVAIGGTAWAWHARASLLHNWAADIPATAVPSVWTFSLPFLIAGTGQLLAAVSALVLRGRIGDARSALLVAGGSATALAGGLVVGYWSSGMRNAVTALLFVCPVVFVTLVAATIGVLASVLLSRRRARIHPSKDSR